MPAPLSKEVKVEVEATLEANPTLSVKELSDLHGISKASARKLSKIYKGRKLAELMNKFLIEGETK